MKHTTYLTLILLLLVATTSCHSKKSTVKTSDAVVATSSFEEMRYKAILDNYAPWQTLVVRGRASLGDLSSSFELRMIHNQAIQISLRPLLGIEIARMIMTQDSIFVYDKINKRSITATVKEVVNGLPIRPTLSNVQSMLTGQPFIPGNDSITANDYALFAIETLQDDWVMQPKKQIEQASYLLLFKELSLIGIGGWQEGTSRQIAVEYSDFDTSTGYHLPTAIAMSAQGSDKKYTMQLSYNSASYNTQTSIEKLSGHGYEKITLSQLLKSLTK